MAARRGLNKGRGLESLIPQKINKESVGDQPDIEKKESVKAGKTGSGGSAGTAKKKEPEEEKKENQTILKVTQIIPNHDQPRKAFDPEALAELTASVQQYGILQPILVQKKGRYYEIIAGERRWRAAKEAGLKEVPVIIRQFDEQAAMEISLIENIQRENLNVIEEAEAYQTLIEEFHLTQEEAARKVGKSRAAVANILRLLGLSEPVRAYLISGELSMGHARALLALEDPELQEQTASQVIAKKWSVRETEKQVKKLLKPEKRKKEKVLPDEQTELAYQGMEERISSRIGTKAVIHRNGNKGKIEIPYDSQEELERIVDLIG